MDKKEFTEACQRLDSLRKDCYRHLSLGDKVFFKKLLNKIGKNPDLLRAFLSRLGKDDYIPEQAKFFDVDSHVRNLNAKFGALGQDYILNNSSARLPECCYNTREIFTTNSFLSTEQSAPYIEKVKNMMNLFQLSDKPCNQELSRLLKEYAMEIKIADSSEFNGSLDCFPEDKRVVLTLHKALVEDDEKLPFMLAHELGHFIDVANRPTNTSYAHKSSEEAFADMVGVQIAKNAGYDVLGALKIFEGIASDGNHPKIKDRINAIKTLNETMDYLYSIEDRHNNYQVSAQTASYMVRYFEALNRRYKRIETLLPLFIAKTKENSMDQNLEIMVSAVEKETGKKFSKFEAFENLLNVAKEIEKRTDEDVVMEEYIAQRAGEKLYMEYALHHFIDKENQDFKRGYCTALPMQALDRQGNIFINLLSENAAWKADPSQLIQEMLDHCPDCIYTTSTDRTFNQILDDKNVKKGAFIIFDLSQKSGEPNPRSEQFHTMIFKGFNSEGNPLCDGFCCEDKNYPLGNRRQCGYIIDVEKIVYTAFEQKYNENIRFLPAKRNFFGRSGK